MSSGQAHGSTTLDFRFDDQVVFIAGAGGSFGRAASLGFASLGASIFGADINRAALDETIDLVRQAGGAMDGRATDTGDPDAVGQAFAALDSTYGRVNVLLNLAGANLPLGQPLDVDPARFSDMLRINLTSKLLTSQQAARRMIAAGHGGSIVNVSSLAGTSVLGRESMAYGVAMSGVIQLTRELAVAWACHGIRVNAIQPCQFVNPGLQALIDDPSRSAIVARMISGIPLGRMGVASEIVGPLVFLASPAAAMVTGIAMPVDGGNLAMNAGGSLPTA